LDLAEQGLFDDLLKERFQLEKAKEEIKKSSTVLLTKEQVLETINSLTKIEKTPENIRSLCEIWVNKIIVKKRKYSSASALRLTGGGEESRTPVQRHHYIGFSERILYFKIRSIDAYRRASLALSL
jgi:hypothetical protein